MSRQRPNTYDDASSQSRPGRPTSASRLRPQSATNGSRHWESRKDKKQEKHDGASMSARARPQSSSVGRRQMGSRKEYKPNYMSVSFALSSGSDSPKKKKNKTTATNKKHKQQDPFPLPRHHKKNAASSDIYSSDSDAVDTESDDGNRSSNNKIKGGENGKVKKADSAGQRRLGGKRKPRDPQSRAEKEEKQSKPTPDPRPWRHGMSKAKLSRAKAKTRPPSTRSKAAESAYDSDDFEDDGGEEKAAAPKGGTRKQRAPRRPRSAMAPSAAHRSAVARLEAKNRALKMQVARLKRKVKSPRARRASPPSHRSPSRSPTRSSGYNAGYQRRRRRRPRTKKRGATARRKPPRARPATAASASSDIPLNDMKILKLMMGSENAKTSKQRKKIVHDYRMKMKEKSWDARTHSGGGIPQYDATSDRHCLWMKRDGRQARARGRFPTLESSPETIARVTGDWGAGLASSGAAAAPERPQSAFSSSTKALISQLRLNLFSSSGPRLKPPSPRKVHSARGERDMPSGGSKAAAEWNPLVKGKKKFQKRAEDWLRRLAPAQTEGESILSEAQSHKGDPTSSSSSNQIETPRDVDWATTALYADAQDVQSDAKWSDVERDQYDRVYATVRGASVSADELEAAKSQLSQLWTALHFPQTEVESFTASYFQQRSTKSYCQIVAQLTRLLNYRAQVVKMLKCVIKREDLVASLVQMLDGSGAEDAPRPENVTAVSRAADSMYVMRELTAQLQSMIQGWKSALPWNETFIVDGVDYLAKMEIDLPAPRS